MGAWRTLHFFDHKTFIKEITPEFKDFEYLIKTVDTPYYSRYLNGFSKDKDAILNDVFNLITNLKDDLKTHPELFAIETAQKEPYEKYENFNSRNIRTYDSFMSKNALGIEVFEKLMIDIIFSNYSDFNPHFIFGKSLLESNVNPAKNSISEELFNRISGMDYGSIYDRIDTGIMAWLSCEEVKLLHLDSDNITAKDEECALYVSEFKIFLKYANDNNLGLIAMRDLLVDHLNIDSKINSFQTNTSKGNYNFINKEEKSL